MEFKKKHIMLQMVSGCHPWMTLPIWYIFTPEWVEAKNGWHHSCMTPRLPFLLNSRELPPVPIHEWHHPFGTSFPLSGWKQKMGDIIHAWHPDYLFLLHSRELPLVPIHEWCHPCEIKKWVTSFMHDTQTTFFTCELAREQV